jgi:hypothetical protein
VDITNDFFNDMDKIMTPADIETYARAKYNGTNDTFFSSSEIQYLIYQAELEMANEAHGIVENIYTTTTTQGTRQYSFPTYTRVIKRVEHIDLSGIAVKLEPITFREDDALTLVNVASTTQGRPQFYSVFNFSIYLRPVPDTTACTIKIYSYNEPQVVTSNTVLDIPSPFHMDITDFVVMHMCKKDKDYEGFTANKVLWDAAKLRAKRWVQKKKRGDAFTIVQNEDNLAVTLTGPV